MDNRVKSGNENYNPTKICKAVVQIHSRSPISTKKLFYLTIQLI